MERAVNGVTPITLKAGGVVEIGNGLDNRLVAGFLKSPLDDAGRFTRTRPDIRCHATKGDIR